MGQIYALGAVLSRFLGYTARPHQKSGENQETTLSWRELLLKTVWIMSITDLNW